MQQMKKEDLQSNATGFPNSFSVVKPEHIEINKPPVYIPAIEVPQSKNQSIEPELTEQEDTQKNEGNSRRIDILSEKDVDLIHAQNLQMLSQLSPEELENQQTLIKSLLSKKSIDFLKSQKNYLKSKLTDDGEKKTKEVANASPIPKKTEDEEDNLLPLSSIYFTEEGDPALNLTLELLSSTTNYFNSSNNDYYATLPQLVLLCTSSHPHQITLALERLVRILRSLSLRRGDRISLYSFNKDSGVGRYIDAFKGELFDAIVAEITKVFDLKSLVNKQNITLSKNAIELAFWILELGFGIELFGALLKEGDPAYLQVLDKIQDVVWGDGAETQNDLFDIDLITTIVHKSIALDLEDTQLIRRSCQILSFIFSNFPEKIDLDEKYRGLLISLGIYCASKDCCVQEGILNGLALKPQAVLSKYSSLKNHLENIFSYGFKESPPLNMDLSIYTFDAIDSIKDFEAYRRTIKAFAKYKSINSELIKMEMLSLIANQDDQDLRVEFFLSVRNSIYLPYSCLNGPDQKSTVYLLNQLKLIEYIIRNSIRIKDLKNPLRFIFCDSSKPSDDQLKFLLDLGVSVDSLQSDPDQDDTYNYSWCIFEPHHDYDKVKEQIERITAFIDFLSPVDMFLLYTHLTKFYAFNTNQVFLNHYFHEFVDKVIRGVNKILSNQIVEYIQIVELKDEPFLTELIDNYLYCSFSDEYFAYFLMQFLIKPVGPSMKR